MTSILTIEDEKVLRETIAEELEDTGYDVYQAGDGMEGLEMILKHKPNLVLCDINMPRKNGYQLMKEIREKYPVFAEMPFIFLSALADRERVVDGLKDGADGYLTKPVDFELLQATIKASLRQIDRIKRKNAGRTPGAGEDSIVAADGKLEDPIDTIMEIVQSAVETTDAFGVSLERADAGLGDSYDPEKARTMLASLAKAIKDKNQGNLDLKRRVVQTSRQFGLLPRSKDDGIQAVSGKLEGQIDAITKIIQSSVESADAFSESIEQAGTRLRQQFDPEQAKAIMATLVKTIKDQEHGNLDLNQHLVQTSRQVEHLKKELAIARADSLTDDLTEIANRKCFDQTLDRMMAEARKSDESLCLVMIDIDHFKRFNDTYGHPAGDSALKLVAATIKSRVKGCDHVARYGGEEFVVILPEVSLEIALKVSDRIRKSIIKQELVVNSTGESRGHITLSMGVGCLKADDSAQTLIKRTDACLYAAKNSGRNRVFAETNLPNNAAGSKEYAA